MSTELIQIPDFSITDDIPITLIQPYVNNGHILFADNFSTTPRLAQYLLQNGTTRASGQIGKIFSEQLASACLEKGRAEFYHTPHQRVLAVKYSATKEEVQKRQKIVHLLSTAHSNNMENSGKSDKDRIVITKPVVLSHTVIPRAASISRICSFTHCSCWAVIRRVKSNDARYPITNRVKHQLKSTSSKQGSMGRLK